MNDRGHCRGVLHVDMAEIAARASTRMYLCVSGYGGVRVVSMTWLHTHLRIGHIMHESIDPIRRIQLGTACREERGFIIAELSGSDHLYRRQRGGKPALASVFLGSSLIKSIITKRPLLQAPDHRVCTSSGSHCGFDSCHVCTSPPSRVLSLPGLGSRPHSQHACCRCPPQTRNNGGRFRLVCLSEINTRYSRWRSRSVLFSRVGGVSE